MPRNPRAFQTRRYRLDARPRPSGGSHGLSLSYCLTLSPRARGAAPPTRPAGRSDPGAAARGARPAARPARGSPATAGLRKNVVIPPPSPLSLSLPARASAEVTTRTRTATAAPGMVPVPAAGGCWGWGRGRCRRPGRRVPGMGPRAGDRDHAAARFRAARAPRAPSTRALTQKAFLPGVRLISRPRGADRAAPSYGVVRNHRAFVKRAADPRRPLSLRPPARERR
jgi:hypothetical protein